VGDANDNKNNNQHHKDYNKYRSNSHKKLYSNELNYKNKESNYNDNNLMVV